MKFRLTLSLFAALIATGSTYANNSFSFAWDDQLILKGEFTDISTRSVAPVIPFSASVDNNVLGIEFSAPVGNVTITVSGSTGVVYSKTVDITTIGQQASLSLEGLAIGSYLLEFKNSDGGYVYGEIIVD